MTDSGSKQSVASSSAGPVGAAAGDQLAASAEEALPAGRLAEQLAEGRPLRIKFGIDPTAPDIHLGHVVVLRKLREFQDAGHTVVLIIGDYTARVGDPSGQSAERPVLSEAEIKANAATFQEQAFKVLDRDRTEVRFNSEWLAMSSGELFELLKRATVARLLERDDFTQRMEAGKAISTLELLYPVLQGYDSVAVEADVELGGTDQKFNLLFARDIQQAFGQPPQSILTMPILSGIDGSQRMSKTLGNYVGVTEPAEEMFGKLMSIPDELMESYYELVLGVDPPTEAEPVEAKRALARQIVERFWDDGAAEAAEAAFDRLHVEHQPPAEIEEARFVADGPVHLPALIADAFDLTRSEGRRLIEQGGVKLDGRVIDSDSLDLEPEALDGAVLQVGKRRHRRLRAG
jgi:tyrosyl-tRNA synthetase